MLFPDEEAAADIMKIISSDRINGFRVITSYSTNSDNVDKRTTFYQLGKLLESHDNRIQLEQLNEVKINNNKKSA